MCNQAMQKLKSGQELQKLIGTVKFCFIVASLKLLLFSVAPTVDVNLRNCQSANSKDPESPPDPLEPWSVKGITAMNKILAWEDNEDST